MTGLHCDSENLPFGWGVNTQRLAKTSKCKKGSSL